MFREKFHNFITRFQADITFMLIPSSQKKTYKMRVNLQAAYATGIMLLLCIVLSIFSYHSKHQLLNEHHTMDANLERWSHLFYLLSHGENEIQTYLKEYDEIGRYLYTNIWAMNLDALQKEQSKQTKHLSGTFHNSTKYLNRAVKFLINKEYILQQLPLGWPVRVGFITSEYGIRTSPFGITQQFHTGYDFANVIGTPIISTGNGIVTFAGYASSGYGLHVKIDHGFGFRSLYAHGSKLGVVTEGQFIKKGDVIMYLGQSGNATGPHLHYEIRLEAQPNSSYHMQQQYPARIDPKDFIKFRNL